MKSYLQSVGRKKKARTSYISVLKETLINPTIPFKETSFSLFLCSQSTLFLSFPQHSLSSLLRGWESTVWWAPAGSVDTRETLLFSFLTPAQKTETWEAKWLAQDHQATKAAVKIWRKVFWFQNSWYFFFFINCNYIHCYCPLWEVK